MAQYVVSAGIISSGVTLNAGLSKSRDRHGDQRRRQRQPLVRRHGERHPDPLRGLQEIENAAVAYATTLSGGTQIVEIGGVAIGAVLDNGGLLLVASGATTDGGVIGSGGFDLVCCGGTVSGADVASGGVLSAATIEDFGYVAISSGGIARAATVASGGVLSIDPGGVASGTVLSASQGFGSRYVHSGGSAIGTIVDAGADNDVPGTVTGIIPRGGRQDLYFGTVTDTIISSGGLEDIVCGGSARGTTILSGSTQSVDDIGTAYGTTVLGGGGQLIQADGSRARGMQTSPRPGM